ncbi:hypothetical protein BASA61_002312 [Batrachochytrium salamandrivorans]|nr:hypothetical protein BASA61_002312 [Batrachochytrium salamandrivorans]
MRLSTGIILSILSANVFAIEHPNDVHSSSLLARRAVMADTDDVFLQKRGGDKGKKKQAKSKSSFISNSGQGGPAYTKLTSKDDSDSDSSSSNDTEEDSTNLAAHPSSQDRGATGGRENGRTKVDSDQEGSGIVNFLEELPIQLFSCFRKKVNRENSKSGLILDKHKALAASKKTAVQFGGEIGESISKELYEMLAHALVTSWGYQAMYNDPAKPLFDLKLPSAALDEQIEEYEGLRTETPERIKIYITAIEDIIKNIDAMPGNVFLELKKMMRKTDDFHTFIFNMVFRYSSLLESLEISKNIYIQYWVSHLGDIKTYKSKLAGYFEHIKEMVEDALQNSSQQGSSKSPSSMVRFRKPTGSKPKSPKGGASHNAQSSGGTSKSNVLR